MQPVIPPVKASVASTPRAQSRRGSPKAAGEELYGILKSGKSRRRRKKRRSKALRWVNVPDEIAPWQQDAVVATGSAAAPFPAATATGTLPQQAPLVGLAAGASLGPLMYTPAGVPAPPVPTAAAAVLPEQGQQGTNYNARQYFLGREDRVADVAAISPAVLSPAYGAAVVQAYPSPYALSEALPMSSGASSESSKSLEDRASGSGGSGAQGPVASKLAMALFLTLVVGSLLCLLSFAIFVFTAMQQDHTDNSDATAQLTDFTDLEGPPTSVHIATSVTVPPTSSDLHLKRMALVNRPDDEGSDGQSFSASATPIL
ncbi:hypothetical protein MTO96_028084 [Rhipicephalus appendiculatus]